MNCLAGLLTSLAVAALAAAAGAQPRLAEARKQHLPPVAGTGVDVRLADLDRDGDLDAVVADATLSTPSRGRLGVWQNRGDGVFRDVSSTHVPVLHPAPGRLAVADLDADGDNDVIAAGSPPALYLNDGQGRLSIVPGNPLRASASGVVVADFDRNGFPDVLVLNVAPTLFLNQGGLVFLDATANLPVLQFTTPFSEAADFDRDGDQDILVALASGGPLVLLRNDGQGRFTGTNLPGVGGSVGALALGDAEGDGDVDAFAVAASRVWVFENDGTTLTPRDLAIPARVPFILWTIAVADVEGDGDSDLVVAARTSGNELGETHLWLAAGGVYVPAPIAQWPALDRVHSAIAPADVDGDRDVDLVLTTGGSASAPYEVPDTLLLNDGTGAFLGATATPLEGLARGSTAVTAADLDGDGRLDLVHDPVRLLRQTDGTQFAALDAGPAAGWRSPLALDVDRDGDLDILGYHSSSGRTRLALNQGAGGFVDVTATHLPAASLSPLAAGDADGDGDVDVFLTGLGTGMLINQGNGMFAAGPGVPGSDVFAAAFADFDRDGDNDLVVAASPLNLFFTVTLFFRQGGTYASRDLPLPIRGVRGLIATDVDGDGAVDLVLRGGAPSFGSPDVNALFVNDGAGNFAVTTRPWPARTTNSFAAAAADVDADGDVDLLFTNSVGQPLSPIPALVLFRNDGAAGFVDASATIPTLLEDVRSIAAADFDRDGDADVVLSGAHRTSLWVNFVRHLAAPHLARLGGVLALEVSGEPGDGALLALSPLGANIPWPPYGCLGVDPGFLYLLPAQVIAPTRLATFALPVPPDQGLHGVALYLQAVVVPPQRPGAERLTGTVREVLVRS